MSMSTKKRLGMVAAAALLLLAIGLTKVIITTGNTATAGHDFLLEYMMGYSIPIVSMGVIAFGLSSYVLRDKKTGQANQS